MSDIDTKEYRQMDTFVYFQMESVLASALVSFQGENLEKSPAERKLEYLRSLPGPIFRVLVNKLDEFEAFTEAFSRQTHPIDTLQY